MTQLWLILAAGCGGGLECGPGTEEKDGECVPEDADGDGDGFVASEDCDDADASANPEADEVCDGVDNDCDGDVDEDEAVDTLSWYADVDMDGWGDDSTALPACDPPSGYIEDAGDCEDGDAAINPDAEELCDGLDNDCDGTVDEDDAIDAATWFQDSDADGYGNSDASTTSCEQPTGYVADATDCDDLEAVSYPDAHEVCDELDNDCDGDVDEEAEDAQEWHRDLDGDGFGDADTTMLLCSTPTGYVLDDLDCDDSMVEVYPDADEICNGVDDNCDGEVDEDEAVDAATWYLDADGDGYGGTDWTTTGCDAPSGYLADSTDCNDLREDVNPGAAEVCDDADVDEDCDGLADDEDVDGAEDPLTFYSDDDGDGYGDPDVSGSWCVAPSGYVTDGTDCDDTTAETNPFAEEVCGGGDENCDGYVDEADAADALTWYLDWDGDGYGAEAYSYASCEALSSYVADSSDCDDTEATVYPGAEEVCDDSDLDEDCDGLSDDDDLEGAADLGTFYVDSDGDGYGDPDAAVAACDPSSGVVADSTDCDDASGDVNPGASEFCGGGDEDCDGAVDEDDSADATEWYLDDDGDGFGAGSPVASCVGPEGHVADGDDCDDLASDVHPDATELCDDDDVDEDCNGLADDADGADGPWSYYEDLDGDGYGDEAAVAEMCDPGSGYAAVIGDCDDDDVDVSPDAAEECDGVDEDCNGYIDDGYAVCDFEVHYNEDEDSASYGHAYMVAATDTYSGLPYGALFDGFSEGRDYCNDHGYEAIVIDDEAEWEFFRETTSGYTRWTPGLATIATFFIGYECTSPGYCDYTASWEWVDGTSGGYPGWASGWPIEESGYYCGASYFIIETTDCYTISRRCSEGYPIVCESGG